MQNERNFPAYMSVEPTIEIKDDKILAAMRKKRNLPELLSAMKQLGNKKIPWLNEYSLAINAAPNS